MHITINNPPFFKSYVNFLGDEKREKAIEEVTKKLSEKFCTFSEFFEDGTDQVDPNDNYMTKAKQALDVNSMKLKKEILVLEGEKEEAKSKIAEMKEFVSKHKGKEITKDNIDDFVDFIEQDSESKQEKGAFKVAFDNCAENIEIKAKEHAIEDTIDLSKKLYRKKTIDLRTYLDSVRELAEEQFLNIAMRQKLMALYSGVSMS